MLPWNFPCQIISFTFTFSFTDVSGHHAGSIVPGPAKMSRWWASTREEVVHFMVSRKQRQKKGLGIRQNLQRHASRDPLEWPTPAGPYLSKFLLLPKIAPPTGDQAFNTGACGGHLIFHPPHGIMEWDSHLGILTRWAHPEDILSRNTKWLDSLPISWTRIITSKQVTSRRLIIPPNCLCFSFSTSCYWQTSSLPNHRNILE
jgi:hypothetical protein